MRRNKRKRKKKEKNKKTKKKKEHSLRGAVSLGAVLSKPGVALVPCRSEGAEVLIKAGQRVDQRPDGDGAFDHRLHLL